MGWRCRGFGTRGFSVQVVFMSHILPVWSLDVKQLIYWSSNTETWVLKRRLFRNRMKLHFDGWGWCCIRQDAHSIKMHKQYQSSVLALPVPRCKLGHAVVGFRDSKFGMCWRPWVVNVAPKAISVRVFYVAAWHAVWFCMVADAVVSHWVRLSILSAQQLQKFAARS